MELTLNGQTLPARIWEGQTANGVPCHAYITRIAVHETADASEFERELSEMHRPISAEGDAIPARLIIGLNMGIYRTEDGRSWMHINFGRKSGPAACAAPAIEGDDLSLGSKCGRMSVALCDGPVGKDLAGKPTTCDMPICGQHRTRGGDNVDFCDRHAHLAKANDGLA